MEYLHRNNIFHSDIRPENVFYDDLMNIAKLSEFGIRKISESSVPNMPLLNGSNRYISPEMIDNKGIENGSGDVWALGITVLELCLGRNRLPTSKLIGLKQEKIQKLFRGKEYSQQLIEFICKSIKKNESKRASVQELMEMLPSWCISNKPTVINSDAISIFMIMNRF